MTTWAGGPFGERATCVLAPNANFMTLEGTNTWVLREPEARRSVVVDPGPEIMSHLDAVADVAGEVAVVLLTHGHADHSAAARSFAERVGCGVRALDPQHRLGSEGLGDGDVIEVDGLEIRVVGTPGHTSDSLSFVIPAERAVLTGDTVLGRGTAVVAHPDGRLGAYLDSLHRLHALAESQEVTAVWPGHGPVIDDALTVFDYYLAHRKERLEQVREAVRELTSSEPAAHANPGAALMGDGPAEVGLAGPISGTADVGDGLAEVGVAGPISGTADVGDGLAEVGPAEVGPAEGGLARKVVERVYADVDPVLWGAAELSVRAQLAYLRPR